MELALNIVLYCIETVKYYLFYNYIFENKVCFNKLNIIVLTGANILFPIIKTYSIGGNSIAFVLVTFVFPILVSYSFLNEKIFRAILTTIGTLIFIAIIDVFSLILIEYGEEFLNIYTGALCEHCVGIITIIFLLLVGIIIKKVRRGYFLKINLIYMLILDIFSMFMMVMILILKQNVEDSISSGTLNGRVLVVFILVVITMYALITLIIALSISKIMLEDKIEDNKELLRMQEQLYIYQEIYNDDIRRFKHDIRSHIGVLYELSNENKNEELQSYLERSFDIIKYDNEVIKTNNVLVDGIISQYITLAKNESINLEVKGHMPVDTYIDPFDICVVFSNVLKNALEAAKKSDDKNIYFEIRNSENEIMICEKNHYSGELRKNGEMIISTKNDLKNHGYGLKNIYESVQRYNGIIQLNTSSNMFEIMIMMKNEGGDISYENSNS